MERDFECDIVRRGEEAADDDSFDVLRKGGPQSYRSGGKFSQFMQ